MITQTRTETDREFVIRHVDYRLPESERVLTAAQERTLYYLADGFGKRSREDLDRINGGYDWSHYRDSSEEAFHQMASLIRFWLEENAAKEQSRKVETAAMQMRLRLAQFWTNPSAENFLKAQRAMLDYQDAMRGE